MSAAGRRLATIHMELNLSAVVLYIVDWWLRRNDGALGTNLWIPVVVLEIVALVVLGSSGWIGGKMTFKHKIGVVENADPEATEIGRRERLKESLRPRESLNWRPCCQKPSVSGSDIAQDFAICRRIRARFRAGDKISCCSFSEIRSFPE